MTSEELAKIELEKLRESNQLEYPIDPFKLLKKSGVVIILKDFENLEGIIINDDKENTIVGININRSLQRQRFTAAHEYCHFIKDLKKSKNEYSYIDCVINSNEEIEKYAELFAGYFLMPTDELKNICDVYKDNNGYISFESVTTIAEYFGVSFNACLNRIAYGLGMIDGDISKESLKKRMSEYKITEHRKKLIKTTIDNTLLSNIINSMYYNLDNRTDFYKQKFLQNYIYNDNKIEGLKIKRSKMNEILADLNFNGINSKYFKSDEENIVMTLGNINLQKYVLNTKDEISIKKCTKLHSLLYEYVPYKDDVGRYRRVNVVIKNGTIQPVDYNEISDKIDELDKELQFFLNDIDKYDISDYIEQVAYFTYKFIIIHPFRDGNGRISRAIMNWLLVLKKIPPIYIDNDSRDEYYNSLSEMDLNDNPNSYIMFIKRRIINTVLEINQNQKIDDIEDGDDFE